MAQYYYFNESGEKIGPVAGREIKSLAEQGIITPETALETDTGRQGRAGQINGLFPATPPPVPVAPSLPVPPIIERNPFSTAAPSRDDSAMNNIGMFGKSLASGCGKENPIIWKTWVAMMPLAIFCIVFLCVFIPTQIRNNNPILATKEVEHTPQSIIDLRYQIRQAATEEAKEKANKKVVIENERIATAIFWSGVIGGALLILYTVFNIKGIEKTNITVYENGIVGTGCGKYFDVNFDLHDFQLSFDKITSVDKHNTAIIIHAGAQYKCYVANPVEMQTLIVRQQQNMRRVL